MRPAAAGRAVAEAARARRGRAAGQAVRTRGPNARHFRFTGTQRAAQRKLPARRVERRTTQFEAEQIYNEYESATREVYETPPRSAKSARNYRDEAEKEYTAARASPADSAGIQLATASSVRRHPQARRKPSSSQAPSSKCSAVLRRTESHLQAGLNRPQAHRSLPQVRRRICSNRRVSRRRATI